MHNYGQNGLVCLTIITSCEERNKNNETENEMYKIKRNAIFMVWRVQQIRDYKDHLALEARVIVCEIQ